MIFLQQPRRVGAGSKLPEAVNYMAMGRGRDSGLRWSFFALLAAGAIGLTHMISLADAGKPVMNAKAKRGAAIFQQNCVSCHNKQADDTTPFGPPNLHGMFSSKPLLHPTLTPQQAADFIKKGAAPMPAFAGILTEAQINDLIAYLKVQ